MPLCGKGALRELKGKISQVNREEVLCAHCESKRQNKKSCTLKCVLTKATILIHNYHITRLEGEHIWIF